MSRYSVQVMQKGLKPCPVPPVGAVVYDGLPGKYPGNRIVAHVFSVDGRYAEEDARLFAAAPDTLAALKEVLSLVDGLPWHMRDAVYKAYNARVGDLAGSLPKPIADARDALAFVKGTA